MSIRFAGPHLAGYSLVVAALLAMLVGAGPAAAQSTGTIAGAVQQAETGEALPGANVVVAGADLGAATDAEGRFIIEDVPAGDYELIASVLGYEETRQSVTVAAGETTDVTLTLGPEALQIREIVVERTSMTGGDPADIPGSVHYISPAELETFDHDDIHHVVGDVPGVYVQDEDGYGLRPNIGMRGTGLSRSSKITVMEDGVLAAPAPYAAPAAYYFPEVGRMQGVEVRKGSSQIQYGPYTTGGAINFISTPIPDEFGGQFDVSSESDAGRNFHGHVGGAMTENVAVLAETNHRRSQGFKDITGFDTADEGLGFNTGFEVTDFLGKARLSTSDDASIYQALTARLGRFTETSNETYLGLTAEDFEEAPNRRYAASQEDVMNTDRTEYQLQHFARFSPSFDITTTAYHNTFQRNWYKLDGVRAEAGGDAVGISDVLADPDTYSDEYRILTGQLSPNDDALEVKNNNREYYSQGVQTVAALGFTTADWTHDMEVGVRVHRDEIDRFQWENAYRMAEGGRMQITEEREPGTESNRVTGATAVAAHLQHDVTRGALTISPGLRYENITVTRDEYATDTPEGRARTADPVTSNENTVDVFMPGLGVDYRFTNTLRAFAGVHRGFAPPGSNPETDPEESINYEIGLRYDESGAQAELIGFFNDYDNLLGRDLAAAGGAPTGQLFNGGDVDVAGLELTGRYNLARLLETSFDVPLRVSYTFTDTEFQTSFEDGFWGTVEAGDELPYVPRHQGAAHIGVENLAGFGLTISGRYAGEVRTVAGQGNIPPGESIDSHVVFDLAVNYAATEWATVFGTVRNLADNAYAVADRPAGLRPGLPRTLRLGVKANF